MPEFAQGHEFLVSLLISHHTSGDIRYHADCLGQSVNVGTRTPPHTHTCSTHRHRHSGAAKRPVKWPVFSLIYARPHTHTHPAEERNSWVQSPSQSSWSSLPPVAHTPASLQWLPHICQDKLKGIEASCRKVRHFLFVNHQNLCREAFLSGGWCVGFYYYWNIRPLVCFSKVMQLFTRYMLLQQAARHQLNKQQIIAFSVSQKFSMIEADHWVFWVRITVWLPVAPGVWDSYTKEYGRQMET